MSNDPLSGVSYLLDGFSLLAKPGLKRFVVIPLIINIFFFVALFFVLRHYVRIFDVWFEGLLPAWLHWLSTILWLLFLISFFLVFIYLFVTIANIISAPFNSFLAEQVELYLTGKIPESRSLYENIKDIPRILGRQFSIIAYYTPRAILLLILFFIPLIQSIAPFLWFLFSAWFLAITYIDYPSDNHRVPISDVREWLKRRRWVTLGFGLGALVVVMIPFVNFFAIPAAVAGATKFWLEESSDSRTV